MELLNGAGVWKKNSALESNKFDKISRFSKLPLKFTSLYFLKGDCLKTLADEWLLNF